MSYPLLTEPLYQQTIWAGTALEAYRGCEACGAGASWDISIRKDSASRVVNGSWQGRTLYELIQENPHDLLGSTTQDQLLRVGMLDAGAPLSVQVHPDEEYAQAHEGDHGKDESWFIVQAKPGAQIVAGCNLETIEDIREAIEGKTIGDYLTHLNVEAGDFAHICQGELHALGAGVLAIEMSTNSDTTYRFYDYDRCDAFGNRRELHIDKALDVCHPEASSTIVHYGAEQASHTCVRELVSCSRYCLELIDVVDSVHISCDARPNYLTVVSGTPTIAGGTDAVKVPTLRSVFIPASLDSYEIQGTCRVMRGRAC